jgi:sugar lactone lactonase YvrE
MATSISPILLRRQGEISLVTGLMRRPNGVAISPDGKLLYVADSQLNTIVAFHLDAKGRVSQERLLIPGNALSNLAPVEGTPDGLRVAESGNLNIACRGIAVCTPECKPPRIWARCI